MENKKILIVDDEEDILKAAQIRIKSWGYDVITASDGKEAIGLIKANNPDLVLLDINMPVLDGIKTLKKIRSFNKKLPVIMVTAYADKEKFKKVEKLEISGFIHKRGEPLELLSVIKVALQGK